MKHVVKKRSAIAIMLSIMTAVTFGAGYGAMSMAAEPTFAESTVTTSDEEDVFAFENSKERKTLRAFHGEGICFTRRCRHGID